jgi:2-polyprenyl-3-methyl-5-hydroxy-6-metoxy-1,4-benzoquinol methylase
MVQTYKKCPVCGEFSIYKSLAAKDYTVSGQSFEIWECTYCTLRFTQDIPSEDAIGQYYKSAAYISHSDTSKGLINNIYHSVRRHTLKTKRRLIESAYHSKGRSLLDMGAGTGVFARYMQHYEWDITGIEPDEDARKNALEINAVQLFPKEYFFTGLQPGSFDVITMWHVLEHVHRLPEYIEQLKKLLKPKGILIIAVPNYTSYDAAVYREHWAAYDVPRHLYHFSPASMRTLLSRHELVLQSIKPMWFDSVYVSLLSEQYKTGKKSLLKGSWNGIISNCKALFKKERCSSLIYIIGKK